MLNGNCSSSSRRVDRVLSHDFPTDASGKAIPYGVYDLGQNAAMVNVGTDHDTPEFAVASIKQWWKRMGNPVRVRSYSV